MRLSTIWSQFKLPRPNNFGLSATLTLRWDDKKFQRTFTRRKSFDFKKLIKNEFPHENRKLFYGEFDSEIAFGQTKTESIHFTNLLMKDVFHCPAPFTINLNDIKKSLEFSITTPGKLLITLTLLFHFSHT